MFNIENSYTSRKKERKKAGKQNNLNRYPLLCFRGSVLSCTYHSGFEKYIMAYTLLEITPRMVKGKGKTNVYRDLYTLLCTDLT